MFSLKMTVSLQVCIVVALSVALVSVADTKWDGFRSTFSLNPLSKYFFDNLPRTALDALDDGFVKISDCDTNAKWRGNRYMKDDDPSIILLYDVNGYIAGLQTTVPKGFRGFPSQRQMPPFVEETEDRLVISSYFVDPAIICTTGRTAADFDEQGTGSNLYIQNGTVPETDSFMIPRNEKDLVSTKWVYGKCFPAMGNHYWYNISYTMDCDDFFPVFILYNKGQLTAYGFIIMANLPGGRREKPLKFVYRYFFQRVPRCTYFKGRITALHIYLTNRVLTNTCGLTNQG